MNACRRSSLDRIRACGPSDAHENSECVCGAFMYELHVCLCVSPHTLFCIVCVCVYMCT